MNPLLQNLKTAWHKVAYQAASISARLFLRSFTRIRVTGRAHLPQRGPFLLVCNHISHFDPPLLASVIWRKVAWVVALDMYAHPVGWAYFTAIESIPVDRTQTDRRAPREILRRFRRGEIVGLFPEGGIRAGPASVLGGAAMDETVGGLAHLGQVPVIPCVILGSDKLYAWRAWLWRTTIDIRFGPAVHSQGESSADARRGMTHRVVETMVRLVEELKAEFALQERDLPKTPQERWAEAKHG
ncbi:MAG: 1-acyl-sn-glycerol-3-phosphate acyltransferase [Verrucomicrobia bacterium]|nr:1-acyl-sn-glycerol-3-phosphate acyltransferase [Verrucomicrobiota bacterium]